MSVLSASLCPFRFPLLVLHPGNSQAIHKFKTRIVDAWRRALSRRSQTARTGTTWIIMRRLADQYLPQVRIIHPYPNERLRVTT